MTRYLNVCEKIWIHVLVTKATLIFKALSLKGVLLLLILLILSFYEILLYAVKIIQIETPVQFAILLNKYEPEFLLISREHVKF